MTGYSPIPAHEHFVKCFGEEMSPEDAGTGLKLFCYRTRFESFLKMVRCDLPAGHDELLRLIDEFAVRVKFSVKNPGKKGWNKSKLYAEVRTHILAEKERHTPTA